MHFTLLLLCDPIYKNQRQQYRSWSALILTETNCWIICFMSLTFAIKAWLEALADCEKQPGYFMTIKMVVVKCSRWTPLPSILICSMYVLLKD